MDLERGREDGSEQDQTGKAIENLNGLYAAF